MRVFAGLLILLLLSACGTVPPRQVVQDAQYLKRVLASAEQARNEGRLRKVETLGAQLTALQAGGRKPLDIPFIGARSTRLEPPAIADLVQPSTLYLALCYRCPNCKHLHLMNAATGFVVAPGVVATNRHVIEGVRTDPAKVKEGYLVAADATGRIWPVEEILAVGGESDAGLIRLGGTAAADLPALAFSDQARTGTRVYCLGHPQENHWRFTEGLVARHILRTHEPMPADGKTGKGKVRKLDRPVLMVDVTCEYAPGSSGAPIVDTCGNVVAMVESVRTAGGSSDEDKALHVSCWVRECVAEVEIRALVRPVPAQGVR